MSLLQIRNLTVDFITPGGEQVKAVRGADMTVAEGETVAVVGESGSGKSVTMMATLGLLPKTASVGGNINFAGRNVLDLTKPELRAYRGNDIGVVFQDPMSSLNPVQRIGAQVAETIDRRHTRRFARSRAISLLDEVGIPEPEKRSEMYPHQFSGGMRQRVMIAMALAAEPRLLIADEPTTALDVTVQAQILDLVRRIQQDHDMAVVWVTHDLGVVAHLADRVSVMYAGRVVEDSTCARAFKEPLHPYTQDLLTASPRLDSPLGQNLPEIIGQPPDPRRHSSGCPYAPRCPLATARCHEEMPPETEHAGARVLCWYPGEYEGMKDQQESELQPGPSSARPLLRTTGIRVTFKGSPRMFRPALPNHAVADATVHVMHGESVGLVGESGSGKSSLARAIMGIHKYDAGKLWIDRGSKSLQMVFQDPAAAMNPSFTVGDIIEEPLLLDGWKAAPRRERVKELLSMVELPQDITSRHSHEFSGGQKQRISIARALALSPDLLICDEAVSSLDVSVQAQIINLLRRLRTELDLSLLFIAHDLSVIRHVSDRVYVMYKGMIVEEGTRNDVYGNPLHPYTKALLAAVPIPDPGAPPPRAIKLTDSSLSAGHGCPHPDRCMGRVADRRETMEPNLPQETDAHVVRCHLHNPQVEAASPNPKHRDRSAS